ncbi:MAG: M1 family metallopeptidase [Cyclobacteriaceae bacterium]
MKFVISFTFILTALLGVADQTIAQPDRWQQSVSYKMEVEVDAAKHQFSGKQELKYTNNSPDTLDKVFYHLYFNAFQPNSMMDVRSRNIADPDRRVMDRISKLEEEQIGYLKVKSLKQDGKKIAYEVEGTVLEVTLPKPIPPNSTVKFDMTFEGQVPLQIRRSGFMNSEGIEYSMAQWYPKMAEYDYEGWHAHPYIAREFYAPWGDFDVKIEMDSKYIIAGTGVLQNADEIGYGYSDKKIGKRPKTHQWHFVAKNVHDFVWAADPDYTHDIITIDGNGPDIHFFYQPETDEIVANWKKLQEDIKKAYPFIEKNFGEYPYSTYSVIQGGDGGMEYPMATLITGGRDYPSLLSVTIHEMMHTWYQMLMATNESYYAWMDEGFTTYATNLTKGYLNNSDRTLDPYSRYFRLVKSGNEEPLSTHSDHFHTNSAYSVGSYMKGAVSLNQLGYIIGDDVMKSGLLRYYDTWKFKHPNLNDFIRIMEKESGLELDWYYDYWVNTTHTIDYGIKSVTADKKDTKVTLERVGKMPMPLDIEVTFEDGSKKLYYIPLVMMRGEKANESPMDRVVLNDWPWTHPEYTFTIEGKSVSSITIDKSSRMADVNKVNNVYNK